MFRKEICEIVRDKINKDIEKKSKQFSYAEVNLIVTTMLDTVVEQLTRGEEVNFGGFGKFERVVTEGREGVNNLTGKPYVSKPHGLVKFRPAPGLKEMVR